jgi:hypothetical protein
VVSILRSLCAIFFGPSLPPNTAPVVCPYCGGTKWRDGPQSGMATNIMCLTPTCQHWFNDYEGILPMEDLHQVGPDRRQC